MGICQRKFSRPGPRDLRSKVTEHSKKSHTPNTTWLGGGGGCVSRERDQWCLSQEELSGPRRAEENSPCGLVKRGLGWVSGTGLLCSAGRPAGVRRSMAHYPPDVARKEVDQREDGASECAATHQGTTGRRPGVF